MDNDSSNYFPITIKLLDIFPSLDELTIGPKEELLIIFQGNNEFYDLKELLIYKREIMININKFKKTIIISIIKQDILYATSFFNIKNGEHWLTFNYENKKKRKSLSLSLVDCIKIKLLCTYKNSENSFLMKNNSSYNMPIKINNNSNENRYHKQNNNKIINSYSNILKKKSPMKISSSEKMKYDNTTNHLKNSYSYIYNKEFNNYHLLLTENNNNNIRSVCSIVNKKKFKIPNIESSYNKEKENSEKKIVNDFNNNKIKSVENRLLKNKLYVNLNSNKNKGKNEINQNNENEKNNKCIVKRFESITPIKIMPKITDNNNDKNINKKNFVNIQTSNINNINDNNDKNSVTRKIIFDDSFKLLNSKKGIHKEIKNQKNTLEIKTSFYENQLNKEFKTNTYENRYNTKIKNYQDKKDNISKELDNLNYLITIKENKDNNNINNQLENLSMELDEINGFYKLKEDFLLLYNDNYNNNVKDDLLKFELDLFLEKVIELIKTYHMNMNQKILENKILENKYKLKISNYLLMNKLYSKLQILKNNQQIKMISNIKVENKNKSNELINKDEMNLFKLLFPSINININNSNSNNNLFNRNNKLKEIINIILKNDKNKKILDEKTINWIKDNEFIYNKDNHKNISGNNDIIINVKCNIISDNNNLYCSNDKNNSSCHLCNNNSMENYLINDEKTIYKRKIPLSIK